RDAFTQALALKEALNSTRDKPAVYVGLSRVAQGQGNLTEAQSQIEQAIKIIEGQRTRIVSPDLRAKFFATQREAYEFYVDLLMRLHEQTGSRDYLAAAFAASESARGRSLLSLLSESQGHLLQQLNPALAARERDLQNRIEAKANEQGRLLSRKATAEKQETVGRELSLLLADYDQLLAQSRTSNPHYASLTQPEPLGLSEIQQQVLDDNTLLLEYVLGEQRSFLFAVTTKNIQAFVLPPRAKIEQKARKFHQLMRNFANPPIF